MHDIAPFQDLAFWLSSARNAIDEFSYAINDYYAHQHITLDDLNKYRVRVLELTDVCQIAIGRCEYLSSKEGAIYIRINEVIQAEAKNLLSTTARMLSKRMSVVNFKEEQYEDS
jgi:hypothetical protein